MILAGKWNNTDVLSIPASLAHSPGMFRNLSSVAKPERDYMLENFNKMIIARNPFERLLSAYRNKLEGETQSARYFQVCVTSFLPIHNQHQEVKIFYVDCIYFLCMCTNYFHFHRENSILSLGKVRILASRLVAGMFTH